MPWLSRLLGHTKSIRAMPYLVRPYFAPDPQGTESRRQRRPGSRSPVGCRERAAATADPDARRRSVRTRGSPAAIDPQGEVESWTWSEEAQAAVAHRCWPVMPRRSSRPATSRPGRMQPTVEADPATPADRAAARRSGPGWPRPAAATREGSAYERAATRVRMKCRRSGPKPSRRISGRGDGGSRGAGRVWATAACWRHADRTAPLVPALNDPNRRVRFAAAQGDRQAAAGRHRLPD